MKKKPVLSWMLYDFGNSAFATTIMAAVLPVFYYDVAAKGLKESLAASYWGYSQTIAVLIVAIIAPILGAVSDYTAAKKRFLMFFAFMGMIASVMLAFVGEGDYLLASLLMIIGTIGFSGANTFYDAFLPEVTNEDSIDKVSAGGYALGYIGGGVLLAINLLMILKYEWFGLSSSLAGTHMAFISVGIWWLIFSIPLFKNIIEEKKLKHKRTQSYVKIGFTRVSRTLKEMKQYKQLLLFLCAFWLYNDGISTIIKMATIYGRDIGIDSNSLIIALLITQFVGIPFAFLFGWLAKKITAKRALLLSLLIYLVIIALGYFMQTALHFYILAICVGFVQGGAQSLSRSIFGRMVPNDRHAEFYGFYGISSKFAAMFGPFAFAIVGQLTGSSRYGILSLVVFFVAGILLLYFVNVEKGVKDAKEQSNSEEEVVVHS
ncbi:MFS transporter [Halobacillus salinarum]|uniref:MFS transporter n=1 Tax=Halobacillus salinarum TaxID=2932257 RepID=A0ABY4EHR3_9BACI|nr:MFS transporter [Halobacillus salinarum]UOQ43535.1 MFS transporter [Halobacillus salinarum]